MSTDPGSTTRATPAKPQRIESVLDAVPRAPSVYEPGIRTQSVGDDAAVATSAPARSLRTVLAALARVARAAGMMDWVAIVFGLAGAFCVLAGLLPTADALATVRRILPLLVFLGSVIALAELTAAAEVFDVLATRIAIVARGRHLFLFVLCVGFAATTTAALNLDTTAVLLTPVMLATATRIGMPGMPLAMTTVWLANTASLLLPVSNLTNLLAINRVGLTAAEFAARMILPEIASIAATMLCLWVFYWRRAGAGDRYVMPEPHQPRDSTLFWVATTACVLFVAGALIGLSLAVVSLGSASLVVTAFIVRRRRSLSLRLIPWQLLLFVSGLFLVVNTISRHGLGRLLRSAIGDDGALGTFRAAGVGALLSNTINNLPTYLAVEAVVPVSNHDQLLGLLIGTNVGPLVTPFASLATLLWYGRCRAQGVQVSWPRFMLTGAVTAVAALLAATTALVITG